MLHGIATEAAIVPICLARSRALTAWLSGGGSTTRAPDSTIKLVVLRQGEEETMSVTLGELPNERQARASVEDHENAGDDATRLGLILTPAGKVMTAVAMGLLSPPSIPMVKQRGRI